MHRFRKNPLEAATRVPVPKPKPHGICLAVLVDDVESIKHLLRDVRFRDATRVVVVESSGSMVVGRLCDVFNDDTIIRLSAPNGSISVEPDLHNEFFDNGHLVLDGVCATFQQIPIPGALGFFSKGIQSGEVSALLEALQSITETRRSPGIDNALLGDLEHALRFIRSPKFTEYFPIEMP